MQDLSFLPGMSLASEKKMELLADVLHRFSSDFTVLTLAQHALEASQMSSLAVVEPRFL
jgi:hypothetical protein